MSKAVAAEASGHPFEAVFGTRGTKVYLEERAAAASRVAGAGRMMDRVVVHSMADRIPNGEGLKESYTEPTISELSGGGRTLSAVKAGWGRLNLGSGSRDIASSKLRLSAWPTHTTLERTVDLTDGHPNEVAVVEVRGRWFPKATLMMGTASQKILVESERRILGPIVLRKTAREGSRPGRELVDRKLVNGRDRAVARTRGR